MALTAKQAIAHIEHTLYDASSDIPAIQVVNTAGKLFYEMRNWNFRSKGPATLNFTASQSYIELPADFGTLTYIESTDALTSRVFLGTLAEVQEYRLASLGSPRDFWVAVSFVTPSGGSRIAPRLEIYPTPSANQTAAITYLYRSRWVDVTDDDADLSGVPDGAAEALYLRLVRQVARSYEDEDVQDYRDTLEVRGSLEYQTAVKEDINRQGSYGTLRNGIGHMGRRRIGSYWDRVVNAPS